MSSCEIVLRINYASFKKKSRVHILSSCFCCGLCSPISVSPLNRVPAQGKPVHLSVNIFFLYDSMNCLLLSSSWDQSAILAIGTIRKGEKSLRADIRFYCLSQTNDKNQEEKYPISAVYWILFQFFSLFVSWWPKALCRTLLITFMLISC